MILDLSFVRILPLFDADLSGKKKKNESEKLSGLRSYDPFLIDAQRRQRSKSHEHGNGESTTIHILNQRFSSQPA